MTRSTNCGSSNIQNIQVLALVLITLSTGVAGAQIQVVSATYGPNCSAARGNASSKLQAVCNGKTHCEYRIDFHQLGDPAPGCAKTFVGEWRCGTGAVQSKTMPAEAGYGSTLAINCPNIAMIAGTVATGTAPTAPATTAHIDVAQLAAKRHLDVSAIQRGAVVAVVDGRQERVTSAGLADWVNAGATFVTRVAPAPTHVKLSEAVYALHPTVIAKQAVELPVEISGLTKDTHAPVTLRAHIVDGTGLLLDSSLGHYVDEVYVYLVSKDGGAGRIALADPIDVIVKALGGHADPSPVRMESTEEPKTVTISVINPQGHTFPVTVSAGSDDAGDTIELAVLRPQVSLSTTNASIIGWGIGTTAVNVEAPELARTGGYEIHLTTTAGGLDPGTVRLDANGNGATTLRSDRSAGAAVSVAGARQQSNEAIVKFRSPLPFLLLAALGGLAGAFVRGKGRDHWGRALAIGVVTAVIAAAGYAVGISGWVLAATHAEHLAANGETVVLVVGFLAGLLGVTVLVPGSVATRH